MEHNYDLASPAIVKGSLEYDTQGMNEKVCQWKNIQIPFSSSSVDVVQMVRKRVGSCFFFIYYPLLAAKKIVRPETQWELRNKKKQTQNVTTKERRTAEKGLRRLYCVSELEKIGYNLDLDKLPCEKD